MTATENPFRTAARYAELDRRYVEIEVQHEHVDTQRGSGYVSLKLRVEHNAKTFRAHLSRGVRVGNIRHQQITFGTEGRVNIVTLPTISVARYSQKGLETALEAALVEIDKGWGDDPRMVAFARPFDIDEFS